MHETACARSAVRLSRITLTAATLALCAFAGDRTANAQLLSYAVEPAMSGASNLPSHPATNQDAASLPAHLKRTIVAYDTRQAAGTIVIDTANTSLYFVLGQGRAIRYAVGVGREGYTWSGTHAISRKSEWPDWIPPAEMIARQPYLPRFIAGGPGNPLGARAMYLGSSIYRIHGTNDPSSIGQFVSSGCIRMTNEDVIDLFNRVNLGARVVVLPKSGRPALDAFAAIPPRDNPAPADRQLQRSRNVVSGIY
jgi:lipoprotein-anchoring transpeptidase ErfK/SrfK